MGACCPATWAAAEPVLSIDAPIRSVCDAYVSSRLLSTAANVHASAERPHTTAPVVLEQACITNGGVNDGKFRNSPQECHAHS